MSHEYYANDRMGETIFLPTVFIQYYLPVTWLFAFFAASAIWELYSLCLYSKALRWIATSSVAVFFIVFGYAGMKGNINRSRMDQTYQARYYQEIWQRIPAGSTSYPNVLFRFPSDAFIVGYFPWDLPSKILARYPDPLTIISQGIPYVLLSEPYRTYLFLDTLTYVETHYQLVDKQLQVWQKR